MSFGSMLDVAIGVAFIFVLLSTIASAIQEMIATVLSVRGKVMQDMIVQLLDNPATTAAGPAVPAQPEPLSRLVIGHPLVAGLSTPNLPGWLHRLIRSKSSPSYIPAANFSSALIETLRSGHDPTLAVSEQVERAVALLPAGLPLRRTLEAFITEAQGDMDLFRKKLRKLVRQLDGSSEGGVYKRFAQYMLLLIGLLLAIVVNADVVQLSETLWRDKGARDAVTQAAMEYVKTAMPQPPPTGSAAAVPCTYTGNSYAGHRGRAQGRDRFGQGRCRRRRCVAAAVRLGRHHCERAGRGPALLAMDHSWETSRLPAHRLRCLTGCTVLVRYPNQSGKPERCGPQAGPV